MRGFFGFILQPPKLVRMRVRVRIRVHVTGGVLARGLTCVGRLSEQPHWRWPKQGAAVAKQGGLGELSGLCKVYNPKRWPAEGAVLFRPIMWLYSASVVLVSTLHLALAIFQQGAPCFGHCPLFFIDLTSHPLLSSFASSHPLLSSFVLLHTHHTTVSTANVTRYSSHVLGNASYQGSSSNAVYSLTSYPVV